MSTLKDDMELAIYLSGDDLDRSPKKNWVENAGGLPSYIEDIAKALHKDGKSISSAIAIAVSRVKVWASGKGVDASTQAKASKALAEWEALKAKNKGKKIIKASNLDGEQYLVLAGKSTAFNTDIVRKAWNAKEQAARDAWRAAHPPKYSTNGDYYAESDVSYYPYAYIVELWTDHLIIQRDDQGYCQINFTIDGNDVTFGDETPVVVTYVALSNDKLSDNEKVLISDLYGVQF